MTLFFSSFFTVGRMQGILPRGQVYVPTAPT